MSDVAKIGVSDIDVEYVISQQLGRHLHLYESFDFIVNDLIASSIQPTCDFPHTTDVFESCGI